jgi:hypothetical protein
MMTKDLSWVKHPSGHYWGMSPNVTDHQVEICKALDIVVCGPYGGPVVNESEPAYFHVRRNGTSGNWLDESRNRQAAVRFKSVEEAIAAAMSPDPNWEWRKE